MCLDIQRLILEFVFVYCDVIPYTCVVKMMYVMGVMCPSYLNLCKYECISVLKMMMCRCVFVFVFAFVFVFVF